MKIIGSLFILMLTTITVVAQKPSVSIKANKNILILDDEKEGASARVVKLDVAFIAAGTKEKTILWSISGTKGKDWEIVSGKETDRSVQVKFNRIGTFDVSATIGYSFKDKKGEEQEDEVSEEKEAFITVSNNLDDLQQLFADKSFVKLVKKAEDTKVKPKYSNDPTPNIFLAKGYYGMYLKGLKDPQIAEPYDEAISATAAAIEMDQNGIFNVHVHKAWLDQFQKEVSTNSIFINLEDADGYPAFYTGKDIEKKKQMNDEMNSGIEIYTSISKHPFVARWIEAAIKYNARDFKTANAIYTEEIPKLLKMENLDKLTETDKKVLKTGIMLSAQTLRVRDKDNTKACEVLTKANTWFGEQEDFSQFLEKVFSNCKKQ
ncbi:MAG: hypothetical protein ACKO7D_00265 [Bacteroidota bacterium]